jgi:hypothetical protein
VGVVIVAEDHRSDDFLAHLASLLEHVTGNPERLPRQVADRAHELLVELDAHGNSEPRAAQIERYCHHWVWHGAIPADDTAERTLTGIAITDQAAARDVHQRVPRQAWHDPGLHRIVEAAAEVENDECETPEAWARRVLQQDIIDVADLESCAGRVDRIAEATGCYRARLVSLIAHRTQARDSNGWLAARVIAVAGVRQSIADHITALQAWDLQVEVGPPGHSTTRELDPRQRISAYADAIYATGPPSAESPAAADRGRTRG